MVKIDILEKSSNHAAIAVIINSKSLMQMNTTNITSMANAVNVEKYVVVYHVKNVKYYNLQFKTRKEKYYLYLLK